MTRPDRRRFLRRTLPIVLGCVLVATLGIALVLRSAWFRTWAHAEVLARLESVLVGRIAIGTIEGDLPRSVVLRNVRWWIDGRRFLAATRVEARLDLGALLRGCGVRLGRLVVEGGALRLVEESDGRWNVERLVRDPEAGPGPTVILADVRVQGVDVKVERPAGRWRARGLAVAGTARIEGERVDVAVAHLTGDVHGVRLTEASGRLAFDEARGIDLAAVALRTAAGSDVRGRLAYAGAAPADAHWDTAWTLAPLAAADLRPFLPPTAASSPAATVDLRGTLGATGPVARLAVAADLAGAAGAVRADGVVAAAALPPRWRLHAALTDVDPPALLGPRAPAVRVGGTLAAKGRGGAEIGIRTALASAAGSVRLVGRVDRPRQTYRATLTTRALDLGPLLGRPEAMTALTGRLVVAGSGFRSEDVHGTAEATLEPSRVAGVAAVRGAAAVRVAGGLLTIERCDLAGPLGTGDVRGTLGLAGNTGGALVWRATTADLRPLAVLAGAAPTRGRATVEGTVAGRLDAIDVRARATVEDVEQGALRIGHAAATLTAERLGAGDAHLAARGDATTLVLGARSVARLAAAGTWTRTGATAANARLALDVDEDGGRRHRLALDAVLTSGEQRVRVDELALTAAGRTWTSEGAPVVVVRGDVVATDGVTLRSGASRVTLAGRAATAGAVDVSATAEAVPLALVAGAEPLAGILGGRVRLEGTLATPRLAGTWRVDEARVGAVALRVLGGTVDVVDDTAALAVHAEQAPRGTLDLTVRLPLRLALRPFAAELAGPIGGAVRVEGVAVAALQPFLGALGDLGGTLDADLGIAGTVTDPELRGPLALVGGRARILATGVVLEDARLDARLDGRVVVVDALEVRSGRGSLRGAGTTRLGPDGPVMDVRAELVGFPVLADRRGRVSVSGWVWLGGDLRAPVLEGTLATDEVVVQVPEDPPTQVAPLDPTITVVGPAAPAAPPVAPAPAPPTDAPALWERAAVKIELAVPRDAWIRRSDANVEVRGWITVWKKPGQEVRLAGEIVSVRGWYAFQGRRFELTEGTVTFSGQGLDPLLHVVATHRAGEYVVTVTVRGTVAHPALTLESTPFLEQGDILSVLVFGRPARGLDRNESLGLRERALGIAGNYVATELRQSVADALGLDNLELETGASGDPGATRISAGKYVGSDVFVSLSHQFGEQTVDEIRLQYSITPRWSIESATDTLGRSGIDVFWHHRY